MWANNSLNNAHWDMVGILTQGFGGADPRHQSAMGHVHF
jgi:hypothetical protein